METLSRRGFIGWSATGVAGLLLPTIARPGPQVFDMGRGPKPKGCSISLLARAPGLRCGDWIDLFGPEGIQRLKVVSSDGHLAEVGKTGLVPFRVREGDRLTMRISPSGGRSGDGGNS